MRDQAQKVLAEEVAARHAVPHSLARFVLKRALKATRHHLALKEQCSLLMSEDSYHMHRLAEQLGRHLVHAGALTHADDVYYLTIDEIKETFRGQMPVSQARALATERRAQIELDALAEPPEVIYGEWRSPTPVTSLDGQDELQGIGASPGQAQGRARIVFDPAAVPLDVSPADILVVPFTDVGWMPLFSGIGGIVTECGGQLSHSAILAREFGLPAVLSVERATHLIREGQQISIDGTQGIIRLA